VIHDRGHQILVVFDVHDLILPVHLGTSLDVPLLLHLHVFAFKAKLLMLLLLSVVRHDLADRYMQEVIQVTIAFSEQEFHLRT
jgi:hypothetical protein